MKTAFFKFSEEEIFLIDLISYLTFCVIVGLKALQYIIISVRCDVVSLPAKKNIFNYQITSCLLYLSYLLVASSKSSIKLVGSLLSLAFSIRLSVYAFTHQLKSLFFWFIFLSIFLSPIFKNLGPSIWTKGLLICIELSATRFTIKQQTFSPFIFSSRLSAPKNIDRITLENTLTVSLKRRKSYYFASAPPFSFTDSNYIYVRQFSEIFEISGINFCKQSNVKNLLNSLLFLFQSSPSVKPSPRPITSPNKLTILGILTQQQSISCLDSYFLTWGLKKISMGLVKQFPTRMSYEIYLDLQTLKGSPVLSMYRALIAGISKGLQGKTRTLYPRLVNSCSYLFIACIGLKYNKQNAVMSTNRRMRVTIIKLKDILILQSFKIKQMTENNSVKLITINQFKSNMFIQFNEHQFFSCKRLRCQQYPRRESSEILCNKASWFSLKQNALGLQICDWKHLKQETLFDEKYILFENLIFTNQIFVKDKTHISFPKLSSNWGYQYLNFQFPSQNYLHISPTILCSESIPQGTIQSYLGKKGGLNRQPGHMNDSTFCNILFQSQIF